MDELPIWSIVLVCTFVAVAIAAIDGKQVLRAGAVTILATFIGVLAGLAVNAAHDRMVRKKKADVLINASLVNIHENVRPFAKLLDDSKVLGMKNFSNEDQKRAIGEQLLSFVKNYPVNTPSSLGVLAVNPDMTELFR